MIKESEIENRLAQIYQRPGADPTSPEFVREVYAVSPARGAAFQKSAQEALKAQRDAEAAAERLASDRIANAPRQPGIERQRIVEAEQAEIILILSTDIAQRREAAEAALAIAAQRDAAAMLRDLRRAAAVERDRALIA